MTTMRRDPLVDDYLRRLEAAAADLPRERRDGAGRRDRGARRRRARRGRGDDEAAVRNVLERLGSPEEIAAAAGPAAAPERGRLENAALIVLSVSFVLPIVGYLIGAGLVLASKAWEGRDKFLGLLIPPVVVLGGAVVVMLGSATVAEGDSFDSGLGPVEIAVLLANVFSGLAAAAYLSARLRSPRH